MREFIVYGFIFKSVYLYSEEVLFVFFLKKIFPEQLQGLKNKPPRLLSEAVFFWLATELPQVLPSAQEPLRI